MSGHHELKALDLVAGAVEREEAVKAAIEAERKRKLTQSDVTRAVKGVEAAGVEVGTVEVTKDKITVSVGSKAEAQVEAGQETTLTPLELWRLRHAKG